MHPVFEGRGLKKAFPGVQALNGASLALRAGEVHALVGENGAGKSTLMKILSGLHAPDEGELLFDGVPTRVLSPRHAHALGVVTIYQELSLVPDLSVAENVFLGVEPTRFGLPHFGEMATRSRALLARLSLDLDPTIKVSELSVAEQQLVEIARALRSRVKILSLDEPTAVLSAREAERLFAVVAQLKAEGVGILYVSHRLQEIFRLCDVATVLRDGVSVAHAPLSELTEEALVRLMVGRELSGLYPPRERVPGKPVLEVTGLACAPRFADVALQVREGEIVGLAGLVGAGRTEVLRAIFGADRPDAGEVRLDGTPLPPGRPEAAVAAGMGLLTEDRKAQGLALGRPVRENATLATLRRFTVGGVLAPRREEQAAGEACSKMRVKTSGLEAEVGGLSGGNQQKVLIARWLLHGCKVLLFDEPTRGIDVGARAEIYDHIHQLARSGLGILVVSSDLPEVLGLCDRILVMADGRIQGELEAATATQEAIMNLATPRAARV